MHYTPLQTELEQLESMSAAERMHYAATRMLECEEVWSLGDEHGWLIRDIDDKQVISIWPYRQLAMEYADHAGGDSLPQATSLEHFVYGILDMCETEEIWLEVYPKQNDAGTLMEAGPLYQLLSGMMETGEYVLEG